MANQTKPQSKQLAAGFPEVTQPKRAGVGEILGGVWQAFVVDLKAGTLTCPHLHNRKGTAQDCLIRWNDLAHADWLARRAKPR